MIFSFAIQPIILSFGSQLNVWYLDDGTLADYPEVVFSDFKKVINLSTVITREVFFVRIKLIFFTTSDSFFYRVVCVVNLPKRNQNRV
jgi:hypothetical protein